MKSRKPATTFILGLLLAFAAVTLARSSGANDRASKRRAGHQISATANFGASALRHDATTFHKPATLFNQQVSPKALQGMPLAFIENRGQVDARTAFLVQGRDTAAYFTAQGMTLALTRQNTDGSELAARTGASGTRQRWNLKLDFVGADAAVRPEGRSLAKAQVNYFSGAPQSWRTGIQTYSSVVYSNLWSGIDLVYSGTTDRLKYEFIVKPGADPQQIRLAYRGTNALLAINEQGQLEVPTPFGTIHDDKPISSQGKGKQVKTEFVVHERSTDGSQAYGFRVGKYNRRKTLVIDPAILVYSGFIGGSGDDEGHSIAVDGNGDAYVTGVTTSAQATFPETAGPDLSYNGRTDAFVAKIKTDGTGLVYAGYIGGDGDEAGHGIAIDASGNAYVTGWTTSTQATFPIVGTLGPMFKGAIDAFVAKINPAGTALSYCGYIGGDDEDEGLGIAVDTTGRAYVTGLTASTEATFPELVGPGLLFKGAIDAFVARVKADGSGLDYAGYLGGSGDDQGRSIAVDAGGNAYVAGLTTSTESSFPMVGTLGATFKGGTDAFVAKVNSTGSAVSYSGFIGGSGIDEAYGIAVDAGGSAYITGRTASTEATFPKLVGPGLIFNGGIDAFVAKINPAGSALSYAGYIGGSGDDEGFGVAIDSAGNAYVTGRTTTSEATFPKANAFDLTLNGASDGFIAKVNQTGSGLTYAGYLGGNGLEEGFGAAVNGLRQVYVAGRSTSADNSFPTLIGPASGFGGASDAFVMRIDDSSVTCAALTVGPATLQNGTIGAAYNQTLTGSGGAAPYSFTIVSGALPPNLVLSSAGAISGTPIQSGNNFSFTVMMTDATGCTATKSYTLMISNCPAITLTPGSLPVNTTFTFYSQNIMAGGGTSPYNFVVSAGTLPVGLSLASSGLLSGVPTAAGTFNFTVRATDASSCFGEQPYALTITGNPGLMFYPLANPVRLLDTRGNLVSPNACTVNGSQPVAANTSLLQMARGICGIPANAQAITGNVTTVTSGGGYLTLYPSGAVRPTVASINYNPNEIVNNVFTVGLGAAGPDAGKFNIYALNTTDTIIDVTGYYAPPAAGGLYFHPLPAPVRLLETRAGLPPPVVGCVQPGALLPGGADSLQTATTACTGIPAAARAIVGNATTVSPQGGGYLTLFPADAARPLIASSNYDTNQIVNGPFTTGLSASGQFNVFTYATTDLVIDVLGYYSAEAVDANGAGLLFTPLAHPVRLLETRNVLAFPGCFKPNAPLNGNQIYTQAARGVCDGLTIPASALGVVGNATTVSPQGGGYLTLWPSTATQPTAATANYNTGEIVNRHFIVGLGNADGSFKMFSYAMTDLVIDLTGYFAP
ncbi:MAG: SBBP repeat-containing protein [Acidobacteriota bacterium]|nr:SBBP repeat-containing protein [Acidobacteriota bacterium]